MDKQIGTYKQTTTSRYDYTNTNNNNYDNMRPKKYTSSDDKNNDFVTRLR